MSDNTTKEFCETVKKVIDEIAQKHIKNTPLNTKQKQIISVFKRAVHLDIIQLEQHLNFDSESLKNKRNFTLELMIDRFQFCRDHIKELSLHADDEQKILENDRALVLSQYEKDQKQLETNFGENISHLFTGVYTPRIEKFIKSLNQGLSSNLS